MSKGKSKRGRLIRDVYNAEKHGATAPRLHELELRINALCAHGKMGLEEAHELRSRIRKVAVRPPMGKNWAAKKKAEPKPKAKTPTVPMRPDGLGPERRQHDRMEEQHTTVAAVLLYTSMRRKERGFSEVRPPKKVML